ncbi:MAG: muiA [Chitinophagaceae bacterium]|nr:muiA [Chitinophagaceae bacterium]
MKKSFLFFILSLLSFTANAQTTNRVQAKAEIKTVTVFLDKAQVGNRVNCSLNASVTEVEIKNLPIGLFPKSIQVTGKGEYILLGVQHKINYLNPHQTGEETKALEDSVFSLSNQINLLSEMRQVYVEEEKMILANQSMKGNDATLKALELEDMADFFRERLTDIRKTQLNNSLHLNTLQRELNKYNQQLNLLRSEINKPSSDVIIKISSKVTQNVQLNLEYITGNARWYPMYDIRTKDQGKEVQLAYKAQVVQETGLNWDNVKLKLSTTNPSIDGTKPTLNKWNLVFYEPVYYKKDSRKKMEVSGSVERAYEEGLGSAPQIDADMAESESSADYTTVVETSLFAEFDIALPYTIESNPTGQLVDVQNYNLPVSFRHGAVPKLSTSAYLLADITGWESLALLPGTAQLYYQNNFVGESYLDPINFKDTLSLSLGADPKVLIEREQVKDFSSKKLVGTNKKEEYAYRIKIRNTKKENINIRIEDQIPVSGNSQIEVELIDANGGKLEIETGKITWDLNLAPNETKEIVFKYSVKYPKGKTVQGL